MAAASTELALFDAGIASLADLVELPSMTALTSLNLHANRIDKISHLEPLSRLTTLNLSSNQIDAMSGLHTLTRLQTLDLACNRIRIIDGLATLCSLRRLLLSYNRIASLAGLVQCHGGQLTHFEAHGNRIARTREAEYLRSLPQLAGVVLSRHGQDNPVCREPGYRAAVLALLPGLQALDDEPTDPGRAARATAAANAAATVAAATAAVATTM